MELTGPQSIVGDLGIFLVALAGFTAFYGLERLADAHSEDDADAHASAPAGSAGVYDLHLGSFLVYNALIT